MGYTPLPEFPKEPPDPSVRDVEDDSWGRPRLASGKKKKKGFYDDDSDGESSSGSDFYSSISGSDVSGSEDTESDSEGI